MWTPLILVLLGACLFVVGALMINRSDGGYLLGLAGVLILILGFAVIIVGLLVGLWRVLNGYC